MYKKIFKNLREQIKQPKPIVRSHEQENDFKSTSITPTSVMGKSEELRKAPSVSEGYGDVSLGRDLEGDLPKRYSYKKTIKTRNGNAVHIFHDDLEQPSRTIFTITDNNKKHGKPISQLEVDHEGSEGQGAQSQLAWTHENHRGGGLNSDLHRLATRHFGTLHSDERLSPASHNIWSKMNNKDIKTKLRGQDDINTFHTAKWIGKSELAKGSLQSRTPYNPNQESVDDRVHTEGWTTGNENFYRDDIPQMKDDNSRVRALHKLHGSTQVKKHPKTGERMFLLHRGMGADEIDHDDLSSWTPSYDIASSFASDYGGNVKSAWIPESQIHHIPKQIGSKISNQTGVPSFTSAQAHDKAKKVIENTKKVSAAQFPNEHEVIVKRHKLIGANYKPSEALQMNPKDVNERINAKAKFEKQGMVSPRTGQDMKAKEWNEMAMRVKKLNEPEKLAASEGENNDLNKGLSSMIASAGLAASLATNPQLPPQENVKPRTEYVTNQQKEVKAPSREFGTQPEDHFLHNIKQVETSGGTNTNHPQITYGMHKGTSAIGNYALMPHTIKEIARRHRLEGGKDPKILAVKKMNPKQIKAHVEGNPEVELELARTLARHVIKRHGNNTPNSAYAWKYGHNMPSSKINQQKRDNDIYVQKFNTLSQGKETQGLKPYRNMAMDKKEKIDLKKPFVSEAQEKFAYANPEKFGGKKEIKEWQEKTPKKLPKKLSKNEKNDLKKAPVVLQDYISDRIGREDLTQIVDQDIPVQKQKITTKQMKNGLYHHVQVGTSGYSHALSTSQDPSDLNSYVAQVGVDKVKEGNAIYNSQVHKDHKGKGYGKQLYLGVLAHHGELHSDHQVTNRSNKVWQGLANNPHTIEHKLGETARVSDVENVNESPRHYVKVNKESLSNDIYEQPKKLAASERDVSDLNKATTTATLAPLTPENLSSKMVNLSKSKEKKKYFNKYFKKK